MAGRDGPHPALRGARRRDVREGEGRRLPAPRDRRGGDDRRLDARAARPGLPHLDVPLARPHARPRQRPEPRHGRALRPRRRAVPRPRRLDAHVRPREALHGRLRDRRRQPPARRGLRARLGLQRPRRGDALPVRRRRLQPGHVRRDDEPRRAVAPAGRLHDHEQPVRHGHVARAPLGRDRPAAQGRGLRRARHALRRHGRHGHLQRHDRGAADRARGAPAGARRGRHLPLPRALDGRPRGVPHEGAGRRVAQARPARGLRRQARRRGRPHRRGARADRRRRDRARRRGRRVRRRLAAPVAQRALRRHLRPRRPGPRLVLRRRAHLDAAPRRGRARDDREPPRPDRVRARDGRAARTDRPADDAQRDDD